jgi:hypothetical protein
MARSAVNDTAREMMAALAKWYKDAQGTLTTAGGTTAYTLTTNSAYTALSKIPLLAIKANAANTAASTLNVDGLGALNLTKNGGTALGAGDFTTGKVYAVVYTGTGFEILNTVSGDTFASGTTMIFQQTAAPTNWTKGATHTNKALRLTTGTVSTGGTTGFTSVFTSRTIAQVNLPNFTLPNTLGVASHSHTQQGSFGSTTGTMNSNTSHTHSYPNAGGTTSRDNSGGTTVADGSSGTTGSTNTDHTHNFSVTISGSTTAASPAVTGSVTSGGSGTAMDFAVQYVDVILATRN